MAASALVSVFVTSLEIFGVHVVGPSDILSSTRAKLDRSHALQGVCDDCLVGRSMSELFADVPDLTLQDSIEQNFVIHSPQMLIESLLSGALHELC